MADMSGYEIYQAVEADGLAKTINDFQTLTINDDVVVPLQDPILGANGSGKTDILGLANFINGKLSKQQEMIAPLSGNSIYNCYQVLSISSNGNNTVTFKVPNDFLEINTGQGDKISLVAAPADAAAVGAAKNIIFDSCYGLTGQTTNFNTQNQNASINTGTLNTFFEIDILNLFDSPGLQPNHHCGLKITHNNVGGAIVYFHILMRYTKQT